MMRILHGTEAAVKDMTAESYLELVDTTKQGKHQYGFCCVESSPLKKALVAGQSGLTRTGWWSDPLFLSIYHKTGGTSQCQNSVCCSSEYISLLLLLSHSLK